MIELTEGMKKFREKAQKLSREELIDIIKSQNPDLVKQINRVEYVFENKLTHLKWDDGTPVEGRRITKDELIMLIDPPYIHSSELEKLGFTDEAQRQLHLAKDPVLWARYFLGARPRLYQILFLRELNPKRVMRLGRRMGKTYSMAIYLLWFSYTQENMRSIVVAPMKAMVGLIYEEILNMVDSPDAQPLVKESITRSVASPQHEINFSNGSIIRFFTTGMKSNSKCFTPDHEVLTTNGWLGIERLREGDQVLSFDKETETMVWKPVTHMWQYDYDGLIYDYDGRQISYAVTPDHKMITKSRYPNSQWSFRKAKDMINNLVIPSVHGPIIQNYVDNYSEEELELWGWWLSEGSGFINGMARFSQVKEVGRKRIIELAELLKLDYKVYRKEIRIRWEPAIYSGKDAYDKFIPRVLFTEKNRHSLLDGLLAGDGCSIKNGWAYGSSSKQLADDVQELAISLGYRSNQLSYWPNYKYKVRKPTKHNYVSILRDKPELFTAIRNQKEIYYQGKVYCPTVADTGVLLVRRNGKIHISGNSDSTRGQEAHLIIADEMDYMGPEDLVALYAMLQVTDSRRFSGKKILIGASTPSGQRGMFWEWCLNKKYGFASYWFPAYCNPEWTKETERDMHIQYSNPNHYRQEIEADWGEPAEGVYPRQFVDLAFLSDRYDESGKLLEKRTWDYIPDVTSARSDFVFGVDWDKYGAGVNVVVMEICNKEHENGLYAEKFRVAYREEIIKQEFTYTYAVERIEELSSIFRPKHIYVDRGAGETQIELLHKRGIENPGSRLQHTVKGFQFSESIEVMDPHTQQKVKKKIKSFMIDNLYKMFQNQKIIMSGSDEELYLQIISYVITRETAYGEPIFGPGPGAVDHAHDALILACYAIADNYDELLNPKFASKAVSVSNQNFLPLFAIENERDEAALEAAQDAGVEVPVFATRAMTKNMRGTGRGRSQFQPIKRKMW